MSEVDRLSNSGLYPALPIADRRDRKHEPGSERSPDPGGDKGGKSEPKATGQPDPASPRPPKSLIDEYA
jgi:hypothetical protein